MYSINLKNHDISVLKTNWILILIKKNKHTAKYWLNLKILSKLVPIEFSQQWKTKKYKLKKLYKFKIVMTFARWFIKSYTKWLRIKINQHIEKHVFNIMNITNYDIALTKFCFKKHNTELNFKLQVIELNKCVRINMSILYKNVLFLVNPNNVLCNIYQIK